MSTTQDPEVLTLIREVERLHSERELIAAEIKLKMKWIRDKCTHPQESLTAKNHRVSGDYLNRGYTDYWVECRICGMQTEKHRKEGSFG